jgi:hypothetical protein
MWRSRLRPLASTKTSLIVLAALLNNLRPRLQVAAAFQAEDFGMPSRQQVKVHINRALRARVVEQKLDEIALAIGELARYVEEIEKDKVSRSQTR